MDTMYCLYNCVLRDMLKIITSVSTAVCMCTCFNLDAVFHFYQKIKQRLLFNTLQHIAPRILRTGRALLDCCYIDLIFTYPSNTEKRQKLHWLPMIHIAVKNNSTRTHYYLHINFYSTYINLQFFCIHSSELYKFLGVL